MAGWFAVLEAARVLCPTGEEPFGAGALARGARIQKGARSTPDQIASAWLGKFVKWGYARHAGTSQEGGRWRRRYVLTEYGLEVEVRAGRQELCTRLVGAVRTFEAARGTRREGAAWKALLETTRKTEAVFV